MKSESRDKCMHTALSIVFISPIFPNLCRFRLFLAAEFVISWDSNLKLKWFLCVKIVYTWLHHFCRKNLEFSTKIFLNIFWRPTKKKIFWTDFIPNFCRFLIMYSKQSKIRTQSSIENWKEPRSEKCLKKLAPS